MKFIAFTLLALSLSACVGGTLSDKGTFEEYPLTAATPQEEKRLRRCLRAIYNDQVKFYRAKKTFTRSTSDLNVDSTVCADILVGLKASKDHFMVIARINHEETTVRWSINEKKEIYEYTDSSLEEELEW